MFLYLVTTTSRLRQPVCRPRSNLPPGTGRSEHLNVKQVETHPIVSIVLLGICLTAGWVAVATDKKLEK